MLTLPLYLVIKAALALASILGFEFNATWTSADGTYVGITDVCKPGSTYVVA